MKKNFTVLKYLACLIVLNVAVAAQSDASDSKRALILEIIAMTSEGVDLQQEFLKGIQEQFRMSDEARASMSETEDNDEFTRKMKADMDLRFKRIQERMIKRVEAEVDFKSFHDKVLYDYYDRSFSEDELQELKAFFRTSTGKKWMLTSQTLQSEVMKATEAELLPQVLQIVKEITDEEFKDLETDNETADGQPPSETGLS